MLRKPESQSRNAVSKPDSAAITCESARPEASPCWLAAAMFIGAPEVARTPSSLTLLVHTYFPRVEPSESEIFSGYFGSPTLFRFMETFGDLIISARRSPVYF